MTITPPTFHDAPELSASRGLATQEIVQALYRLLMLREPDPGGFDTWANVIGNGMRIEDALHAFLTSKEFVTNRMQFCREYFPAARSKILRFESVVHYCDGRAVIFALDKGANDSYTETLRRTLPLEHFIPFILRRARQTGAGFKVADFGANVGAVSLPLAANGIRVLAIEAVPENFIALATAARTNRFSNLLPVNMAALDSAGLVSLAGTGPWATAGLGSGDITICCDTLVNILEVYGFSDADVVKLDIEGAELRALKDADRFFDDRPRTEVIFESNDHTCQFFGYRRNDLLRWFEQRDFSLYAFRPDGLMPVKPDDPQPVPVIDILATRRSPASLEEQGEKIVLMTEDYIMQELLKISTSTDPAIRQHFITEARQLGEGARRSASWPDIASAMMSSK